MRCVARFLYGCWAFCYLRVGHAARRRYRFSGVCSRVSVCVCVCVCLCICSRKNWKITDQKFGVTFFKEYVLRSTLYERLKFGDIYSQPYTACEEYRLASQQTLWRRVHISQKGCQVNLWRTQQRLDIYNWLQRVHVLPPGRSFTDQLPNIFIGILPHP